MLQQKVGEKHLALYVYFLKILEKGTLVGLSCSKHEWAQVPLTEKTLETVLEIAPLDEKQSKRVQKFWVGKRILNYEYN